MDLAPFKDGTVADGRATMDGKYWSQYRCARYARITEAIAFFSGAFSRRPVPGYAALAAANAAVEALGRTLARELAPVRVTTISPGLVRDTNAYAGMPPEAREQMYAQTAATLPSRLVASPDDIASITLSVLENRYMTGSVVDVDGGGLLV